MVPQIAERNSPVVPGEGVGRIMGDSDVVSSECCGVFAFMVVGSPEPAPERGDIRVERNRLGIGVDCIGAAPLLVEG